MKSPLAVVLVVAFSHPALLAGLPAGPKTARPGVLGVVFQKALTRAAEKLGSAECRLVLADFRNAAGRTLAENLSEKGLSASDYLMRLEFRNGRDESTCRKPRVEAFTNVGGSTVWICPGRSLGFPGADVDTGSSALIHEMLHTLGLAENPPTSLEITERVVERCGR
jgi:hypothetical protein